MKYIDYLADELKLEYRAYRKACRVSNVEPVMADFLAGDIPSCVTSQLESHKQQPMVMGAAAGR